MSASEAQRRAVRNYKARQNAKGLCACGRVIGQGLLVCGECRRQTTAQTKAAAACGFDIEEA